MLLPVIFMSLSGTFLRSMGSHHQSTLPSGSALHTWKIDSPAAILVLQHGFGEYAERYVESHSQLILRLNQFDFEVWALDLWGHGRSSGLRSVVNIQKAVEDHVSLRMQAGKRGLPIFLFGHSLGGLVTAGSVAKDGSSVAGVILTGPALPELAPAAARAALDGVARFMPTKQIPLPKSTVEGLCRNSYEIRRFNDDPLIFKGQISFRLAASALETAAYLRKRLVNWQVPILVIHGTTDSYTDYKGSQSFVEGIASQDKLLVLEPGGHHELLNDENCEAVLRQVLDWLAQRVNATKSMESICS